MRFKKGSIIKGLVALLVLGLVVFIFYMSSQTAVNSGHMSRRVTLFLIKSAEKIGALTRGSTDYPYLVQKYDSVIRSFAHIGMYFLLCLILSLVFKYWQLRRWTIVSFTICSVISILDELNQMHYKGRNDYGQLVSGIADLFKDAFGTIAAILVALLIIRIINRVRSKKKLVNSGG